MRKRLTSRRHKALCRSATAMVLLGLLILSGQCTLTPTQSLRDLEDRLGTGRVEVLRQETDWHWNLQNDYSACTVQLAGNENAVLLAAHGLYLRGGGWRSIPWDTTVIDCSGNRALYAGYDGACLFGQVKDPSAAVLYVEGPGANRATLPESTWITRNGCRFFFLPIDKEKRGGPLAVAVCDGGGVELDRRQLVG